MRNKTLVVSMILMLLLTIMPMALVIRPTSASPGPEPDIHVYGIDFENTPKETDTDRPGVIKDGIYRRAHGVTMGETAYFWVKVKNKGNATASFTLKLYANDTLVDTSERLTLTPIGKYEQYSSGHLKEYMRWDTTGFAPGLYWITARAQDVDPPEVPPPPAGWPSEDTHLHPISLDRWTLPDFKVGGSPPWVGPSKVLFPSETFTVNITINNLQSGWYAVGFQFALNYPKSKVEVVNVTEGPFLPQFGETIFGWKDFPDEGQLLVMDYLVPDSVRPYGSGPIATIMFHVVSLVPRGTVERDPLDFKPEHHEPLETVILDNDFYRVPFKPQNGTIEILGTNIGDINYDKKVDIKDIGPAGLAFGSYPGHPRWNPEADCNGDDKIDIRDIATIAKNFGWVAPDP